jgi:hypothetical protein
MDRRLLKGNYTFSAMYLCVLPNATKQAELMPIPQALNYDRLVLDAMPHLLSEELEPLPD